MAVLIISALSTWAMVGLIWVMQIVHYPMLGEFSQHFPAVAFEQHQRLITPLVGPPMALEGVTALILLVSRPGTMSALSAWVAATLLGVALLSTIVLQVPIHAKLVERHDPQLVEQLVATNWIRTVAWTARGGLLAAVLITP